MRVGQFHDDAWEWVRARVTVRVRIRVVLCKSGADACPELDAFPISSNVMVM